MAEFEPTVHGDGGFGRARRSLSALFGGFTFRDRQIGALRMLNGRMISGLRFELQDLIGRP